MCLFCVKIVNKKNPSEMHSEGSFRGKKKRRYERMISILAYASGGNIHGVAGGRITPLFRRVSISLSSSCIAVVKPFRCTDSQTVKP